MSYVTPARLQQFKDLQDKYNESVYAQKEELSSKQDKLDETQLANLSKTFSTVATSGSYNDLIDLPNESFATDAQIDELFDGMFTIAYVNENLENNIILNNVVVEGENVTLTNVRVSGNNLII